MKRKISSDDLISLPSGSLLHRRSRRDARVHFQSLSEELWLTCLSHLGYRDLLATSETSRYLNRLAGDNQLWKALYMQHFDDRHDLASSFAVRDGSLPRKTWKQVFRIGHNWRCGRATTSQVSLRSSLLPQAPVSVEDEESDEDSMCEGSSSALKPAAEAPSTKVAWHGQYYFVASHITTEHSLPGVNAYCMTSDSTPADSPVARLESSHLKGKGTSGSLRITEMQLDALDPHRTHRRLVVFYSNGQFSIFNITFGPNRRLSFTEEHFSSQPSASAVVSARLHSPILATVSSDCSVRIRFVEAIKSKETSSLELISSAPTMRPTHCFAPITMRLSVAQTHEPRLHATPKQFKLTLAYATPYYPAAFTVAIQVFHISVPDSSHRQHGRRQHLDILARSAIAAPHLEVSKAHNHSMTSTSQAVINTLVHDGPYIVASRNDNTISVYQIRDSLAHQDFPDHGWQAPDSPVKMHGLPLRLKHVRSLFGHTASVDAVSLFNGRCVSTGRDGIKVWELPQTSEYIGLGDTDGNADLDESWNQNTPVSDRKSHSREESSDASPGPMLEMAPSRCQWIGLDSSRIVTVSTGLDDGVVRVYHFE